VIVKKPAEKKITFKRAKEATVRLTANFSRVSMKLKDNGMTLLVG
jgi:hypothetical protein